MRRRSRAAVAACATLALVAADAAAEAIEQANAAADRQRHVVFRLRSPQITESSSLVVSTSHPGLAYTANDSGGGATVYVLDTATGALVGQTELAGVGGVDVEAMSACSRGSLAVADIGDNFGERSSIAIYRIPQPTSGRHSVTADRVTLTYADGPRDAESVVCDSGSGRIFVVSKELLSAAVYASPPAAFDRPSARLRAVAHAPSTATDATLLPGGRFAVIRTYVGAAAYRFPAWRPVRSIRLPLQQQGESVAAPDASTLWVGSEGVGSAVLAVPLPKLSGATAASDSASPNTPTPSATTSTEPQSPEGKSSGAANRLVAVGTVTAVGLALAWALWLLGRRRAARRD